MTSPAPPKRPSLLWPALAILAWGFLLADVYLRLPDAKRFQEAVGVRLPPLSRWVMDNAAWAVPGIGLATLVLSALIRNRTARWVVPTVVAVVCFLALMFLRIQAVFLIRPVESV